MAEQLRYAELTAKRDQANRQARAGGAVFIIGLLLVLLLHELWAVGAFCILVGVMAYASNTAQARRITTEIEGFINEQTQH